MKTSGGMSNELAVTIGIALESLDNLHSVLARGYRMRILALMNDKREHGPRNNYVYFRRNNTRASGYLRRYFLANYCVRHVLGLWDRSYPDDPSPYEMLSLSSRFLRYEIDDNKVGESISEEWQRLERIGFKDNNRDFYVAHAALACLSTVVNDEGFDQNPSTSDGDPDGDLDYPETDFDQEDTAYFASCAFSGGSIWDPDSHPIMRRRFWAWWLQVAIPSAFEEAERFLMDNS